MEFPHNIPAAHQELLKEISLQAHQLGQDSFLVGGYVRDFYLHRLQNDVDMDVVTLGSGIALAERVHESLRSKGMKTSFSFFKQFGTAQVKTPSVELEFIGARKESYRSDSRKPLVEDGSLEDDQNRRDFTINSLYWELNKDRLGVLNDPFGGLIDLKKGLIRTPIEPEKTFSDDPLRMMRAVRFAAQLDFELCPETKAALQKMASRLEIVSKERIRDELNKIVNSPVPSVGFALLFSTGLLAQFFPEMVALHGVKERNGLRHKDNFWHTLQVLDNVASVSDSLWLRWAAIMHDIAKPPTQRFEDDHGWTFHGHDALGAKWTPRIFRRLALPMDERMRYVQKLVRLHLRPIALVSDHVSDSAVRRLIFEADNDIEDLMTLCRADITSKNEFKVRKFMRNFERVEKKIIEVEEKDRIRNWKNPLTGQEIMDALDIPPSKQIGIIKDYIKEAILNGDIPNEHDAAFSYMMNHHKDWIGQQA
jgi:tRNA nucleotidyltransferase (CCA-adding enzyme)